MFPESRGRRQARLSGEFRGTLGHPLLSLSRGRGGSLASVRQGAGPFQQWLFSGRRSLWPVWKRFICGTMGILLMI